MHSGKVLGIKTFTEKVTLSFKTIKVFTMKGDRKTSYWK